MRLGRLFWVLIAAGGAVAVGPALADPATPGPAPGPAPGPVASGPAPGPPSSGPATAMQRDGFYVVGSQITPGVYSSAGPVAGTTCYWKRVGAGDAILENALTAQPQVVQIEPTDVAFKTHGCQPWQLTDEAPPGQTPPWLAGIQLRHQLDVLNGLAGQSGNGQLPPY